MVDISVIVPIYRGETYIERSLITLFSQTKSSNVEYILVNDCTPDNSMGIVEELMSIYKHLDIKVVNHSVNKGVAAARQTAIAVAQGEFIIHCDSDDLFEPTMLEKLYAAATEKGVDVVWCDYLIEDNKSSRRVYQDVPDNGEEVIHKLLKGELDSFVWCKMFRRSLIVDNGVEWITGITLFDDLLFCTKAFSYAKGVYYLNEAFVHYIQREGSICATVSPSKMVEVTKAMSEIERFFTDKDLMDKYSLSLAYRKLLSKYYLIAFSRGEQRKMYSKLYSEVDCMVAAAPNLSFDRRIVLKCAIKGHLWLVSLMLNMRNGLKRVLNK